MEPHSPAVPAPASLEVQTPGRAAFAFIFITLVLDMLAVGIMVPVLPRLLVVEFEGGDFASAAGISGLFDFTCAAMQLVASPVLGALSDRYGRRPVILLSNLGVGLDYLLTALAPSLGWLFAARAISGATSASTSAATAYVSDVTPPEQRAARFGLLGAAFGLGFIVGPAVGGLLGSINLRLPFWVSAGLCLVNAAYGFFILPESLPPERRARFQWRQANPLGSLTLLRSRPALVGLSVAAALSYLASYAVMSTFVLYTNYRYGWDERTVGLVMAAAAVCTAIVSAAVTGPAVTRLGERGALAAGLACGVASMMIGGLAPTGALFLLVLPFNALQGMVGPALQSLATRRVGSSEQGQLQGALGSLRALTGLIGPLLFTQAFARGIGGRAPRLPGAPFLLAAALLGVGLLVSWRAARPAAPGAAL